MKCFYRILLNFGRILVNSGVLGNCANNFGFDMFFNVLGVVNYVLLLD